MSAKPSATWRSPPRVDWCKEPNTFARRELAWLDEGSAEFDEYGRGLCARLRGVAIAIMLFNATEALREEFGRDIGSTRRSELPPQLCQHRSMLA